MKSETENHTVAGVINNRLLITMKNVEKMLKKKEVLLLITQNYQQCRKNCWKLWTTERAESKQVTEVMNISTNYYKYRVLKEKIYIYNLCDRIERRTEDQAAIYKVSRLWRLAEMSMVHLWWLAEVCEYDSRSNGNVETLGSRRIRRERWDT